MATELGTYLLLLLLLVVRVRKSERLEGKAEEGGLELRASPMARWRLSRRLPRLVQLML